MAVSVAQPMGARPWMSRRARSWLGLWALLITSALLALASGRFWLSPSEVVTGLTGWSVGEQHLASTLIGEIRLPRLVMAALCGAALGVAGAVLQGVTRNPLVSPDLIGASSGAAAGGALMILLANSTLATLLGAFAGGLAAILAVLALARQVGGGDPLSLVLCGVAVSALAAALVTMITVLADPESELPSIVYWLMGSLADASWSGAGWLAAAALPALAVLVALRFRVNLLALGDEEALALGLRPRRLRGVVVVAAALGTAGTVAVAGIIGWIGLVVPHMARLSLGADHAASVPASALIGASLMVLVDTLARSASAAELPLSVLTALLGTPLFLILLHRNIGLVRDV